MLVFNPIESNRPIEMTENEFYDYEREWEVTDLITDDIRWFVNWAKKNNLSNRTTNAISRGMNENRITMFKLCDMKMPDDFVLWRGLGVKSHGEFMGVFEKLKKDWMDYYNELY